MPAHSCGLRASYMPILPYKMTTLSYCLRVKSMKTSPRSRS